MGLDQGLAHDSKHALCDRDPHLYIFEPTSAVPLKIRFLEDHHPPSCPLPSMILFLPGVRMICPFAELLNRRDVIGGTAACVIAGRLANADASLKILVLEAGPHTKDKLEHTQPARCFSFLVPGPTNKAMSFHVANAAPELNGRQLVAPSGRCVGGGSSVNCKIYMSLDLLSALTCA